MHTATLAPHTLQQATVQTPTIPDSVWITGAPLFWKQGYEGNGIKVGVIDSGIATHPDLTVAYHKDYVQDNLPFHPHGTHVAGTIAANGTLRGVAPKVHLRDYRVLGASGGGSLDVVAQAIRDAVADGCLIINLSLGAPVDYPPMSEAVNYAARQGALLCCASGNAGPNTISYPAFYDACLSVAAVDVSSTGEIQFPSFSSSNVEVDIAAIGVTVLSCVPGGYAIYSGTSMAAPHVAGLAALILERIQRRQVNASLRMLIDDCTVDISAPGVDTATGLGLCTLYPEIPKKVNGA